MRKCEDPHYHNYDYKTLVWHEYEKSSVGTVWMNNYGGQWKTQCE